jgi:CBS-domain-containing membrane protein
MITYFKKFRGEGAPLPPSVPFKSIIFAWLGALIAISTIGFLTKTIHEPLVLGSFGASCVLLFGYPKSPFSQPRNVIAGHFLSTLIGLSFYHFVGVEWWSMALALATSIAVMIATKTVHPPAGSNPLIVFLTGASWSFLGLPTLVGSIILVIVALIYLNLNRENSYPSYWV